MTLVAAYRSNDGGLLLCADREENDSWSKRSVDKIYPIYLNPCTIYLAGSGLSIPIARAHEEIHNALSEAFAAGRDVLRYYKDIIQESLKEVHDQFAEMLAECPMNFLIIIAAKAPNTAPILYWTDNAVMLHEHAYVAFGSGKLICDYFSDRLYEYPRLDKIGLLAVAAFIFREAHKSASGVGDDVDMIFIRPTSAFGETHGIPPNSVREIQSAIPSLAETIWDHWKQHVKLPEWVEIKPSKEDFT
jgi:20S proteasome alpha/beta subunit